MAKLCDGEVIFYTNNPSTATTQSSEIVQAHRKQGYRAVFNNNHQAVLVHGMIEVATIQLTDIKSVKSKSNDALFPAIAAAWSLGISPELIEAGLKTFELGAKRK